MKPKDWYAKARGKCLDDTAAWTKARRAGCQHRKGGTFHSLTSQGIADCLYNGDHHTYSVLKHRMMNGDLWVICLRCNKRWKPPVKDFKWYQWRKYREYFSELVEYKWAVNLPTNNVTSGSVQMMFHDKDYNNANDQVRTKSWANS